MTIGRLWGLTLIGMTLILVTAYSWMLEANLAAGIIFSSEFRLNRAADAWIESKADLSSLETTKLRGDKVKPRLPPIDGTPVLHASTETLPVSLQKKLPKDFVDGQLTVVEIDEPGLLYRGQLLHLFRALPNDKALHITQRLSLADHESERVEQFDAIANRRLGSRVWFILGALSIVLLFGTLVAKATSQLLRWCESLSVKSIPEKPPALPFVEMRKIASGILDMVRRERDATEDQHRFLRFASHELRTPLATASANTELLARHGVNAEAREALSRLQVSIKNMNGLTNTLLKLARSEKLEAESTNMIALVQEIIDENKELAATNNVNVEVVWATNDHTVQPRFLLNILCSNLVGNAIRYTRNGRVEIRLSQDSIEIENFGTSVGKNDSVDEGHGLGLELVAWIVQRADWQWDEDGNAKYQRHRITFTPYSR